MKAVSGLGGCCDHCCRGVGGSVSRGVGEFTQCRRASPSTRCVGGGVEHCGDVCEVWFEGRSRSCRRCGWCNQSGMDFPEWVVLGFAGAVGLGGEEEKDQCDGGVHGVLYLRSKVE